MKKLLLLSLLLLITVQNFAAVPAYQPTANATNVQPSHVNYQQQLLVYALVHHLTTKEYQRLTGKRLTLKQKLGYILLKHKLIKANGKGEAGLAVGGFFLGFFLGPIGVVIALLASKNKTFRKWTWIGFGTWAALTLILILLAVASLGNWG